MAQFVYITAATSFLILLLSIGVLAWLARLMKQNNVGNFRGGLAYAIPLAVISLADVVVCVLMITLLPGAPSDVQATDGKYRDKVVVEWKPAPGATAYHVLRASSPDGKYIEISGSISKTSFMDTSVRPGSYYYIVVASNDVGASLKSDPDPGHRLISDFEFFKMYQKTEMNGFEKLKKLGVLGQETEPGTAGGTISYDAKFDGKAHVVSAFSNYSDFDTGQANHLVLNGTMNTEANVLGAGTMGGKVNVTGNYTGYVRYNLVISGKKKSAGNYAVSQDGGKTETVIPWNYQ